MARKDWTNVGKDRENWKKLDEAFTQDAKEPVSPNLNITNLYLHKIHIRSKLRLTCKRAWGFPSASEALDAETLYELMVALYGKATI